MLVQRIIWHKMWLLLTQYYKIDLLKNKIWHKKCLLLTQYHKIYLLIEITFLSKKNIILDPFFYAILRDLKLLISCLSISIMSNVHTLYNMYMCHFYLKVKSMDQLLFTFRLNLFDIRNKGTIVFVRSKAYQNCINMSNIGIAQFS